MLLGMRKDWRTTDRLKHGQRSDAAPVRRQVKGHLVGASDGENSVLLRCEELHVLDAKQPTHVERAVRGVGRREPERTCCDSSAYIRRSLHRIGVGEEHA